MQSSVGALRGTALAQAGPSRQAGAAAQRGGLQVTCVATPSKPPASNKAKRSKVELIKESSDFLRHPLMQARGCRQPGCWAAAGAAAACQSGPHASPASRARAAAPMRPAGPPGRSVLLRAAAQPRLPAPLPFGTPARIPPLLRRPPPGCRRPRRAL